MWDGDFDHNVYYKAIEKRAITKTEAVEDQKKNKENIFGICEKNRRVRRLRVSRQHKKTPGPQTQNLEEKS